MSDPLADLGLDLDDATPAGAADDAASTEATDAAGDAPEGTEAKAKQTREEVEIGELEFGFAEFLPTAKRGGGERGSKYDFDKLVAPVTVDGKTRYATFLARLQPGVDEDKLKRSVQSATSAANREAKAEGSPAYFATRTEVVDGSFVGIRVFRTDARPKGE